MTNTSPSSVWSVISGIATRGRHRSVSPAMRPTTCTAGSGGLNAPIVIPPAAGKPLASITPGRLDLHWKARTPTWSVRAVTVRGIYRTSCQRSASAATRDRTLTRGAWGRTAPVAMEHRSGEPPRSAEVTDRVRELPSGERCSRLQVGYRVRPMPSARELEVGGQLRSRFDEVSASGPARCGSVRTVSHGTNVPDSEPHLRRVPQSVGCSQGKPRKRMRAVPLPE
jgi:hypothetical protein